MVELVGRLILMAGGLASAGLRQGPTWDLAWRAMLFFGAYSVMLYLMEQRGLRNRGVSGLAASLDGVVLAILLQDAGQIENFGFLTLAPLIWAATRHGSDPVLMAPIIAAGLVSSANFRNSNPSTLLIAQAAGVLIAGLMMKPARAQTIVKEVMSTPAVQEDMTRELRVQLRDALVELSASETRAKVDSLAGHLARTLPARGADYNGLTHAVAEALGLSGALIYTRDESGERLVVKGAAGTLPLELQTIGIEWPQGQSEAQMKTRIQSAIRNLAEVDTCHSVRVIRDQGVPIGAVAIFHPTIHGLEEALDQLEAADEVLGRFVAQAEARNAEANRLAVAELLYTIAASAPGTDDTETLSGRICRETFAAVNVDHVSIVQLQGNQERLLAREGAESRMLDLIEFPSGTGYAGWVAAGREEVWIDDCLHDSRVVGREALKRRVGSFILIPLRNAERVLGYISVATHRAGGLDAPTVGHLRVIAGETARALDRMSGRVRETEGLATPNELRKFIAQNPQGCLVYLDVPRREKLIEKYGRPAFDRAIRQLALRVRALVPSGSLICRRDDGDYIVFLRGQNEETARVWANEIVATAALVPLTTLDGRNRMPMALRAKVATLTPQKDRIPA